MSRGFVGHCMGCDVCGSLQRVSPRVLQRHPQRDEPLHVFALPRWHVFRDQRRAWSCLLPQLRSGTAVPGRVDHSHSRDVRRAGVAVLLPRAARQSGRVSSCGLHVHREQHAVADGRRAFELELWHVLRVQWRRHVVPTVLRPRGFSSNPLPWGNSNVCANWRGHRL